MGAFAVAIHQGRFLRQNGSPLAESIVVDTPNLVAATFQENGLEDPQKDAKNNMCQLLQQQLSAYKKDNPKEKQQKALPVCVLRQILSSKFPNQQISDEQ
jgi:hypothetical protein